VGGLTLAFVAVSVGSYGLLRQLAMLGLLPISRQDGRSIRGEIEHRLGQLAAERGWFVSLRRGAERDLIRARQVDISPDDFIGTSMFFALVAGTAAWALTVIVGGAVWNVLPAVVAASVVFQVPGWNLKARADQRIGQI